MPVSVLPRCPRKILRSSESSPASKPSAVPRAGCETADFVLEVLTARICTCCQVPVQPVTAAGPEHSKPLEKADSLFKQEQDPRFSEIYSSINTGRQRWAARHGQGHGTSLSDFSFKPSALCSFRSLSEQFWVQRLSVALLWRPRSCRIALILVLGGLFLFMLMGCCGSELSCSQRFAGEVRGGSGR